MSVLFHCPQCGMETNVDDQFLGKSGPCAGCGIRIDIPSYPDERDSSKPKWKAVLNRSGMIVGVIILSAITVGMIIWLSWPAISTFRSKAQLSNCTANLKLVYSAMEAYHDDNGHYPPAYVADKTGKPMYSWRVLLLPYLDDDSKNIYRHFVIDKPWNSPENSQAVAMMPNVYSCPADPDFGLGTTSYMVVSGKGFLFDGTKTSTRVEIRDGVARTIMLAEVASSGINWAEPVDINTDKLARGINSGSNGSLSSGYIGNGVQVLMADGTVRFIPDFYSPTYIENMSTIAGRETVAFPDEE